MNKSISYSVSAVLLAVLAYLAFITYGYAKDYDIQMQTEAEQHMIDKKVEKYITNMSDKAATMMTLPLNVVKNTLNKVTGKKTNTADSHKTYRQEHASYIDYNPKVRTTTIYFMLGIVLLLLTYFISPRPLFVISVLTASIIAWFVGVFTPIMTMEVWKQLPLFGHTTFIFQSRGIWSTMAHLWDHSHYVVAMLVILFSVLLPVIKTITLYISIALKKDVGFIELIGKWSMADVFVMSILLATMSLNTEDMTTAQIHAAIYFFAAYVVLSMIGSSIVDKMYGKHAVKS